VGTRGVETSTAAPASGREATLVGPAGPSATDVDVGDGDGGADRPVAEPTRTRLGERRLFLVAVALAALPFLVTAVALITGVGARYLPAGDLAMAELHVRDIGHHQVLTGLYSRVDWSHPGPLQF
jgi:hypothetical protein